MIALPRPRSLALTIVLACVALTMLTRSVAAQEQVHDPLEPMNRGIFWFNDETDTYLFRPIAKGYDYITPDPVQHSVSNFFRNLRFPRYLVSDLVQFKWDHAFKHTGRFLVNTTVGVAGLFDPATGWGMPENEEDFGLALAHHGVPAGPYIVLPILGPSNVRDGLGMIVDFALDPLTIFGYSSVRAGVRDPIVYGLYGLQFVNTRSDLLEALDTAKASSLDYYGFLQGAYYQHRWALQWNGSPPVTTENGAPDLLDPQTMAPNK